MAAKARKSFKNFNYEQFQQQMIVELLSGKRKLSKDGVLTPLIKNLLEASLNAEMDVHLEEDESKNRRNGYGSKKLKTAHGAIEIDTPRDRDGTFEPVLIKKRQTVLNESLDAKILSLFGAGLSYNDITAHNSRPLWSRSIGC